jgi:cobaltochelatase CobS
MEDGDYVWLAGPAGSGKTSLPVHIAATLHRPFVRIAFNRSTDPVDLIGSDKLVQQGVMTWVDGVLTQAIRRPGTIILLDEPTLVPPGIAGMLQTLLDMRFLTLPTGEVVKCAKGVWFIAADNTRGFGDETGRYAGTMQANAALVDRFARMVIVDYMDAAKEASALVNHTGAPKPACERVARFVKDARALAGFGDIPLSLRRMTAFVRMTLRGFDPVLAFADCFETRLPEADRETLRQAFRAQFDANAYAAELAGSPVPPPVSHAPEQAAARNAFDRLA